MAKSKVITGQEVGHPIALHRSGTGRISIGNIAVDFYVLDNGMRVADLSAADASLGFGVASLLAIPGVKEHVPSAILGEARNVRMFRETEKAKARECVLAETIIHICAGVLATRRADPARFEARALATFAELFLADVATRYPKEFVDAITGSVIEKPVEREAITTTITQPYFRTYPDEFYDELYRLRGLGAVESYGKHPSYFGNLTNNIIYKRFAPDALAALKDNSERAAGGKRHKRKLFQLLTPQKQVELQEEYLPQVIELMKSSKTFDQFMEKLDARFPIHRRAVRPKR